MKGQRLKKHELVEVVFARFWAEARRTGYPSIQGITLPVDAIREEISRESGTPRQNNKWIHTQLKKYQQEHGVTLFVHERDAAGEEVLRIADTLVSFQQKKHLYRAEKLRLANALVDYIFAEFSGPAERLNVWMGAGTTIALAAEVLRARIADAPRTLHVCTHNVEVITTLLHPDAAREVELSVARGKIDPVTYTIVPPEDAPLWPEDADLIVQGTSALYDGDLFVESEREVAVKRAILADTTGIKVLLLTLHEMHAAPPTEMYRYGAVDDYDLIIIPRMKNPALDQEETLAWLDARRGDYDTRIKQWHYEILGRATPPRGDTGTRNLV